MSKYTGSFPNIKTHYTHADVVADMKVWAKKIASEKYHYVTWKNNVTATHTCPICKDRKYDNYFGWNCIGFAFAIWHHGGGLKSNCNCHVISNESGEKILKAKTDAEALKLAQKFIGIKDIEVIRNNGKAISKSKAKAGDIALLFDGDTYKHAYFIMSDTKIADSTSSGSTANDIRADRNFDGRYVSGMKVLIRYNGNGTKYRNYIKMGDSGSEVKKLQQFLNWAINSNLVVDGLFGDKTDTAVRAFQTKCKITVDGLFGSTSLTKAKEFNKGDTKMKLKGIDVSAWQNKISVANFKKAKASGINYVILRVGYTGSSSKSPTIDSVFENNYANAISAGLPVGIYYYSLATSIAMAEKEANFVVKKLKGKNITYPVYIDMEDDTYQRKCSKATLASVCNTFCNIVKNAGYIPGVYASLDWFNNRIGNITVKHTKWVAQYYKECQYKGAYDMWQYTSSEAVSGIANKTDVSWCYKDFTKEAKPTPKIKTIDELAHEVIDDKWGSEDERKKRLTNAGYDYDAVQAKVNEILAPNKKKYSGTLPSLTLKKTNAQVINDAVLWAIWIAGDNTFHYGYTNKSKTINAHHNGCYFCGTNTDKGGRSKKGIVDYQHTYCCNPFVNAAWAHGGCVPKALSLCQKGSSWGFGKGSGYDASTLFTKLGHPAKSKLKKGDVLCRDTHVALYIGDGKIAEAGSGDDNKKGSTKWNNSIRVRALTDANYKNFTRVYRFNSSVQSTMALRHGEVSDRVKLWQEFLNWYYDGKLGKTDRYFGDITLKWTKQFQKDNKLIVDGVVGTNTLATAFKVEKV